MSYNKLVRDNIPNIIREKGDEPITTILTDDEYIIELERKLLEECNEVIESSGASRINELADVLEVLIAIAEFQGNNFDDILSARNEKKLERGAFNKKIYLKGVKKCK